MARKHSSFVLYLSLSQDDCGARQVSKGSDVMRSRKGVVKMLIVSVSVYVISYVSVYVISYVTVDVISYAPAQIPLFYNLVSPTPFRTNWTFLVVLQLLLLLLFLIVIIIIIIIIMTSTGRSSCCS